MGAITSQITSLTIVYSTVYPGADQKNKNMIASQITILTIVYSTVYPGADKKKTSKLRVTGLCAGNSPVTGVFPAQMASNAENVPIWWRHHAHWIIHQMLCWIIPCLASEPNQMTSGRNMLSKLILLQKKGNNDIQQWKNAYPKTVPCSEMIGCSFTDAKYHIVHIIIQ